MHPQPSLPLLPPWPGREAVRHIAGALHVPPHQGNQSEQPPGHCPVLQQGARPNARRNKTEKAQHDSRPLAKGTSPNTSQSQGIMPSSVKNWVFLKTSGICIVVHSFTALRIICFLFFTSGQTKNRSIIEYRTWSYLNASLVTPPLPQQHGLSFISSAG